MSCVIFYAGAFIRAHIDNYATRRGWRRSCSWGPFHSREGAWAWGCEGVTDSKSCARVGIWHCASISASGHKPPPPPASRQTYGRGKLWAVAFNGLSASCGPLLQRSFLWLMATATDNSCGFTSECIWLRHLHKRSLSQQKCARKSYFAISQNAFPTPQRSSAQLSSGAQVPGLGEPSGSWTKSTQQYIVIGQHWLHNTHSLQLENISINVYIIIFDLVYLILV